MIGSLIVCAIFVAVLNRASGMDRWAPGRNIYYTGPALGIAVGLAQGWTWGLAALLSAWAYRLPGWLKTLDIGKDEGDPGKEALVMFGRGLYAAPYFVWAVVQGQNPVIAAFLLVGAAGFATLAYAFGNWVLRGKYAEYNTASELLAGFGFGLSGALAAQWHL